MAKRRNNPMCRVGNAVRVDVKTGEETPVENGGMWLLPAAPDKCQWCAVDHDPSHPHNKDSLYYHMKFKAINGRCPTWTDAMAHCDDQMKSVWREELIRKMREVGREIPTDLL